MTPTFACFVTGTDTDVGKTLVSSAMLFSLARQNVKCAGMKPVAAGATLQNGVWRNVDVESLTTASSVKLPTETACPYLLRTPASPHIALRLERTTLDPSRIAQCYRDIQLQAEAIVVEGVGGFRVPLVATLTSRYDTADMAVQFGLPLVLVVGMRLGCLNHALLTAESITARGLQLAGWVANTTDPTMQHLAENVATLQTLLPAPLIGVIPHFQQVSATDAASHLDFSCLPGWPNKQRN